MPEPSWEEVDDLFQQALDRRPEERPAFFDQACAGRPELRTAVERLLRAAEGSGRFLETPIGETAGVRWGDVFQEEDAPKHEEVLDRRGERVGPWRLLEEVGRGGMATVYLAERADGVLEQKVAVKVIRRGLDTADVVRRFIAERQLLSSLSHPNIARLLDGGSTQDGLPYFALEYVRGLPITTYCDDRRLSVEDRLRLFCEVGGSVHHAHRRLVVHRDLKPRNIMVDADGVPKLLDFGIAKLLGPDGGDGRTRTGMHVLTPEYAAPEQLSAGLVSTATDVYQLGLLLCVLVAGARPSELDLSAWGGATSVTRSASARIQSLVTLEAATLRRSSVDRLRRRLVGDVATIVEKALRAEPEERYASAEAMVADVQRHLAGLPIAARSPTLAYRTRKLFQRHRWLAPVATVMVMGVSGYVHTLSSHATALEIERNVARLEAERAQEVQSFMVDLFRSADPYAPADPERGADITVREALGVGTERVRTELEGRPQLQAALFGAIADVYQNLDLTEAALELGAEALGAARIAPGPDARNVVEATSRFGWLLRVAGAYDSARVVLGDGYVNAVERLGTRDTLTASFLVQIGRLAIDEGDLAAAEPQLLEAVALLEKADPRSDRQLATAWAGLADAYGGLGRPTEARAAAEKELELLTRAFGDHHPLTALATVDLADGLDNEGRDAEAIELYRSALERLEAAFGPTHGETLNTRNNLAVTLQEVGDFAGAERLLRENLAIHLDRAGEQDLDVAQALQNLAVVLHRQDRLEEAEVLLGRAYRSFVAVLPPGHYMTAFPLLTRSGIELERGQVDAAEATASEAERVLGSSLGPTHFATAVATCLKGRALMELGRVDTAREALDRAADVLRDAVAAPAEYRTACLAAAEG